MIVLALVLVAGLGYLAYTGNLVTPLAGPGGGTAPVIPVDTTIPADATEAVVEYVHDGDTLFLEDGRKVRLLGVNTPEIGDNAECYGDEATALLRSLLHVGTHVWVVHDLEPLDQYGRSLLFVYTDDGTNVNLALLEAGAAEVEMYEPNLLLDDEIYAAEDSARATGAGMWTACG